MTTTHDDDAHRPTDAELQAFAADPSQWGEPHGVLTGAAAAAAGRADLEAAGVDVDAFERRMGRPRRGRPRLGPGETGTPSPRLTASISPEVDARLLLAERLTGKTRSELVREALENYLPNTHGPAGCGDPSCDC